MANIDELLEQHAQEAKGGGEEKPVETPEKPVEKPVETPVEENKTTEFDFVSYYKNFGIEAATREEAETQLKERLDKYNELKDYPTKYETDVNDLKAKYDALKEQVNPLSYFSNEQAYIREQLVKAHPELNPTALIEALGDTNKLSPIEIVSLGLQLTDGDIFTSKQAAIAQIERNFGIDLSETSFEELPQATQNAIRKEAKSVLQNINTLKGEIKLPEVVDPETLITAKQTELRQLQEGLKAEWKPFVDSLTTHLDKVTIKDGEETVIEYQISDSYKAEIQSKAQQTLDFLASKGLKVSDETKAAVVNELKTAYLLRELPKMFKTYANDREAAVREQLNKDVHNVQNANQKTNAAPLKEGSKEAAEAKIMESLKNPVITQL
jgi:hypothetical protein